MAHISIGLILSPCELINCPVVIIAPVRNTVESCKQITHFILYEKVLVL
jgi:hypothetical protein